MQFERAVRDELRREAESVRIPDDAWDKISQQLDREKARAKRFRAWSLSPALGSGVALAVAMGMLFVTLMPPEPNSGTPVSRVVARPGAIAPATPPSDWPADLTTDSPVHMPAAVPEKPVRELPHQPQAQSPAIVAAEPGPSRLPGTITMMPR